MGGFHRPFLCMSLARELVPRGGAKCTNKQNWELMYKGDVLWNQQIELDDWASQACGKFEIDPKAITYRPNDRREAVRRPVPAKTSI